MDLKHSILGRAVLAGPKGYQEVLADAMKEYAEGFLKTIRGVRGIDLPVVVASLHKVAEAIRDSDAWPRGGEDMVETLDSMFGAKATTVEIKIPTKVIETMEKFKEDRDGSDAD